MKWYVCYFCATNCLILWDLKEQRLLILLFLCIKNLNMAWQSLWVSSSEYLPKACSAQDLGGQGCACQAHLCGLVRDCCLCQLNLSLSFSFLCIRIIFTGLYMSQCVICICNEGLSEGNNSSNTCSFYLLKAILCWIPYKVLLFVFFPNFPLYGFIGISSFPSLPFLSPHTVHCTLFSLILLQ